MRWRKLGRVYVARGERPWAMTHAYCPTPVLQDDRIRVFCAFLDAEGIGRTGWVDVDREDPTRVLAVSERPALDIGEPGTFDDNGVTPMSVCRLDDGTLRLYYAGWQLGVRARYYLFTGLAESRDGGETFQRVSRAPVLDRSDGELTIRSSVHVQRVGDAWRMWYAGGSEWVDPGDAPVRPRYALRHLTSSDGVTWPEAGELCLEPANEDEHGFTRPSVLDRDGVLRMWYSLRTLSKGYRIGYAESHDGLAWERRDDASGIDVSDDGWDSDHVATTALLETPHDLLLFYNGNGYGRTGFGVAIAEEL